MREKENAGKGYNTCFSGVDAERADREKGVKFANTLEQRYIAMIIVQPYAWKGYKLKTVCRL